MIIGYSDKPRAQFQSRTETDSKAHTFGWELEIEDGNRRDQLVNELDALNLPIYQKLDGSLHGYGLEIITHPGSLEWHRRGLRIGEIMRLCRKYGWISDDSENCGLHVHVGRKTLGRTIAARRETAAKLVLLVDALWDNGLVKFTRRRNRELDWCARPDFRSLGARSIDSTVDRALYAGGQDRGHGARYTAVNLTNDNTVEFRIFKGTLKRDRLVAALELVDTLVHYAMKHSVEECYMADTLANVVTWDDYGTSYKELVKECRRLGLLPADAE